MKQINFLKYAFILTLFIYTTACDKEDTIEGSIPEKVHTGFNNKFPNAIISDFNNYVEPLSKDTICEISFTNKNGANTIAWYKSDGTWKMTQTELKTINDLTPEAKDSFTSSIYGSAQIDKIYKTERDEIDASLNTLVFKISSIASDENLNYAFINDDGLFLNKYSWTEYNLNSVVSLSEKQFKFIDETYPESEIRGYINNSGSHEYFILHEDKVKSVLFYWNTAQATWKETRYELDIDTKLPDNVIKYMNIIAPDFVYTNIYYIETGLVNKYLLVDKNDPREFGHYVSEDI